MASNRPTDEPARAQHNQQKEKKSSRENKEKLSVVLTKLLKNLNPGKMESMLTSNKEDLKILLFN